MSMGHRVCPRWPLRRTRLPPLLEETARRFENCVGCRPADLRKLRGDYTAFRGAARMKGLRHRAKIFTKPGGPASRY